MVIATVGFCGWLMAPQLWWSRRPVVDPVAAVIDGWPTTARRTRTAALRMVASVAGPWRTSGLALKSPLSPHRLTVAGAAWAFAGVERWGRVADPLDLRFDRRPWRRKEGPSS
jgi:hypothetical protein